MVGLDGLVLFRDKDWTKTGLALDGQSDHSPSSPSTFSIRDVRPSARIIRTNESGMSAFSRFIDFMSNPLFRELFNEYEVHRTSKSLKIVNLARGVSAPFSHPSLEIHAAIDF